jgi:hypothetical protein
VNSCEVGVFEKANKVILCGFLKSSYGGRLKAKVGLEVLSNFTNKALKRELSDQEFGRLLITANFSESDSTWAISVRLFNTFLNKSLKQTSGGWGGLSSSLRSELFSWSFSSD